MRMRPIIMRFDVIKVSSVLECGIVPIQFPQPTGKEASVINGLPLERELIIYRWRLG